MTTRQRTLKTVLWALIGIFGVVTIARFVGGLGATTGLNDATPWGFWIAFDVMAGVALAAGGFVLAAAVYIFRLEQYKGFARPAILTALLGYAAVAVGLLYDLGLPWHIWHPIVFPQPRSVLFEVAMCVMIYLTVLLFEFSPAILEHRLFNRPLFRTVHRLIKKLTIVLVIAGIVLSTLHQSSLGSLFLIAPHRVHPLWYSPIIWILFYISAIGLGLMMVTLESFFSAWYFGHPLKLKQLSGLGRAAGSVLLGYAALRLGDLATRGGLAQAFDGSGMAALFWFELSLGALVPGLLLMFSRVRSSSAGLLVTALMTVFGVIGYRFDVAIVAFGRPDGVSYFPSWIEIAVSLGVVACALMVFIWLVERLRVYPEDEEPHSPEPTGAVAPRLAGSLRLLLPHSMSAPRRYSLAAMLGAVGAIFLLADGDLFGAQLAATPVSAPRTIEGKLIDHSAARLMVVDGNRDGRGVLFAHDQHVEDLGDKEACEMCHHQRLPFDSQSACSDCHRDMYLATDIFDHSSHINHLEGRQGCSRCHRNADQVKTRETATPCADCHQGMIVTGSSITPPTGGSTGLAVGYLDAMHGLCISCHQRESAADATEPSTGDCALCHQKQAVASWRHIGPYAAPAKPGDTK